MRPDDLAARLGGDEFAVLLEDVDAAHGEAVAQRVLDLLAAPALDAPRVWMHGSIGIASARAGSVGADELIRRADVAMYRAKEAGKGQSRVWSPEMHPGALARAPRRDEIAAALEAGELVAHFQPIVSLATGEVVAAEALARWEHPRHGLLGPAAFVRAAEATGQVVAIDRAVLEHACRAAAAGTGSTGVPPAGASVHANLSGVGLRSFEVVAAIEEVLARTGLEPGPAGAGDHRERAARPTCRWPAARCPRCATSACGSRWTTSARATRRCSRCASCPSTSSRSPSRSSTARRAPRTTAR